MIRTALLLAFVAPLALPGLAQRAVARNDDGLRVVRPAYDEHERERRLALPEGPPPLRGWRAPIDARAADTSPELAWTFELPAGTAPERDAVALVARRLARDGLLATTVRAIEALGADEIANDALPAARLFAVGLPADLLTCFAIDGVALDADVAARVRAIATRLARERDVESLAAELARAPFAFRPSGFRAAPESGQRALALVRLQLSRGDYWLGEKDGGNLDVVQQLIESAGDVPFLLTVGEEHAHELLERAPAFTRDRAAPVTVVVEPWTIAQWAQDNGEPGWISCAGADGELGAPRIATLVPRWASRGEGAAAFVPGETFLADGLARAGHDVVASSLLFQGGNLLCVHDPARDERVLVAGEAEVWRNVALGLSADQARAALVAELGADRIVVLPAVSFHVDAEVTFRAHAGELVAFVNDQDAAVRALLTAGVGVLEREGVASAEGAAGARAAIDEARWLDLVNALGPWLTARALGPGVYPEAFAELFSSGPSDSGVANLQVLLAALDVVTSRAVPAQSVSDAHAQIYLRALARDEAERSALHESLAAQGWRVVPVPGLVAEERGVIYVNALHDGTRTWIPVYGGLYEELDRAARTIFERTLGPDVTVIGVRAAESQRRNGALHCSAATYYAP